MTRPIHKITITSDDGDRFVVFSPPRPVSDKAVAEMIGDVMAWPAGYHLTVQVPAPHPPTS